jgi:hypothetical protein
MPRKVSVMSIQELRRCLAAQEQEVARLKKKREKIVKELGKIDKAIAAAGGSPSPTQAVKARAKKPAVAPGRKSRKRSAGKPLIDYILGVLKGSPKGRRVKDVMNAVTKAGYASKSKDFYGIVATALREGPQFKNISRGIYALK